MSDICLSKGEAPGPLSTTHYPAHSEQILGQSGWLTCMGLLEVSNNLTSQIV